MTVRELREILSQYDDDIKIYLCIEDIVDNYGYYINSTAAAKQVIDSEEWGIEYGIMICGTE